MGDLDPMFHRSLFQDIGHDLRPIVHRELHLLSNFLAQRGKETNDDVCHAGL